MQAALGAAALVAFTPILGFMVTRATLPNLVPMHHDITGNVDRYGSPNEMWIAIALFALIALGALLITRWPGSTNTMIEPRSEEGWQAYYRAIRWAMVEFSVLMTALNWAFIGSTAWGWPIWLTWVIVGAVMAVVVVLPLRARNIAKASSHET